MGKKDILTERLLSMPKDFEQREMDTLMSQCGCVKNNRGRTSGSAVEYVHQATQRVFAYHRPHPGNILKPYILKAARQFLQSVGEIQRKETET